METLLLNELAKLTTHSYQRNSMVDAKNIAYTSKDDRLARKENVMRQITLTILTCYYALAKRCCLYRSIKIC